MAAAIERLLTLPPAFCTRFLRNGFEASLLREVRAPAPPASSHSSAHLCGDYCWTDWRPGGRTYPHHGSLMADYCWMEARGTPARPPAPRFVLGFVLRALLRPLLCAGARAQVTRAGIALDLLLANRRAELQHGLGPPARGRLREFPKRFPHQRGFGWRFCTGSL